MNTQPATMTTKPSEKPSAEVLLSAARSALRSYQYNNGSRDLAKGIADAIDDYLGTES